jgi:hypothetical protein
MANRIMFTASRLLAEFKNLSGDFKLDKQNPAEAVQTHICF